MLLVKSKKLVKEEVAKAEAGGKGDGKEGGKDGKAAEGGGKLASEQKETPLRRYQRNIYLSLDQLLLNDLPIRASVSK